MCIALSANVLALKVKITICRRSHAEKLMTPLQFYKFGLADETSNDKIAGNGRILKVYMCIVWFYLVKKYIMLIYFSTDVLY